MNDEDIRDRDFYHPEDFNRTWNYDSSPDPYQYYLKYHNLNNYYKVYEKWEDEQRREHGGLNNV